MPNGRGVKVGPGGFGAFKMIESACADVERPNATTLTMSNLFIGRSPSQVGSEVGMISSSLYQNICAVGWQNRGIPKPVTSSKYGRPARRTPCRLLKPAITSRSVRALQPEQADFLDAGLLITLQIGGLDPFGIGEAASFTSERLHPFACSSSPIRFGV